jgi:hypothetical protein
VKGWKKIYQANSPQKQGGVAILISDKVDSVLHQKEITIINLYAPNVNALNFTNHTQKGLKAYIDSNTVVVGDLNTPLSPR